MMITGAETRTNLQLTVQLQGVLVVELGEREHCDVREGPEARTDMPAMERVCLDMRVTWRTRAAMV